MEKKCSYKISDFFIRTILLDILETSCLFRFFLKKNYPQDIVSSRVTMVYLFFSLFFFQKKNFQNKTRTYETSQSCARVHLGHLKKEHLKKKSKKSSKVEIFTKVNIQNIFRGKAYFCL